MAPRFCHSPRLPLQSPYVLCVPANADRDGTRQEAMRFKDDEASIATLEDLCGAAWSVFTECKVRSNALVQALCSFIFQPVFFSSAVLRGEGGLIPTYVRHILHYRKSRIPHLVRSLIIHCCKCWKIYPEALVPLIPEITFMCLYKEEHNDAYVGTEAVTGTVPVT